MGLKRYRGTSNATLKDVAAHAGVSFKTVSNVINGRTTDVSAETRDRVLASIATLNYRPNLAARHLRKPQAGVLALAIPDFSNPYFADLSAAVIAAAAERNYTVLIDYTSGRHSEELLIVRGLRPHLIDGVILNALALNPEDLEPKCVGVSLLLLGERLIGAAHDHVMIDNIGAARLATQHLLRLGRRRIAVIGVPDDAHDAMPRLRLQGYREALAVAGVPFDPLLVATLAPASFSRPDGIDGMQRLLARGPVPDAVLCMNDLVALGAMKALRDMGYRIPDDVAVAGFDDIEEGQFATPALTTIAPDKAEIGRLAVSLLLDRVEGVRTGPAERIEPGYKLIVRQSTSG